MFKIIFPTSHVPINVCVCVRLCFVLCGEAKEIFVIENITEKFESVTALHHTILKY